jgi:murein DD-endopeptidase MepM/ murein hydrolase activator NlpD
MLGHRTTPRGILFLLLGTAIAAALSLTAAAGADTLPPPTPPPGTVSTGTTPSETTAAPAAKPKAPRAAAPAAAKAARPSAPALATVDPSQLLFPVLGKVQYRDDFGEARGQGAHQGNDIMVARQSPVIAVEDGRVEWWTTSARAGCMLYLYGRSGTTYLYIHLNNDETLQNDNRGGCVADTTYTVKDGAKVRAGEQIAWSGDSGDADGNPHLHFEAHPGDGAAVSPFERLNGAVRTLFPARLGTKAAVGIRGVVVRATAGTVDVSVTSVRWWPGGRWVEVAPRVVQVAVDDETDVDAGAEGAIRTAGAGSTLPQTEVTVVSRAAKVSLEDIAGVAGALVAQRIRALA